MKNIDNDNIDDIMFQLLEGEITGSEREQLLEAIYADPEYLKLWNTWQHTVLSPEPNVEFDSNKLKKKPTKVFVLNYKMAIAAMLVLGIGLGIYLSLNNQENSVSVTANIEIKPKPKTPVIQLPPAPSANKPLISPIEKNNDTLSNISSKEKIRTMAKTDQLIPENKKTFDPIPVLNQEPITPKKDENVIVLNKQNNKQDNQPLLDNGSAETILVSIESNPIESKNNSSKTLLSRIFGSPKIKLAPDSTTRTSRKLIIENKKYQIIAGF